MDGTFPACLKAGQDYNFLLEYVYAGKASALVNGMYAVSSKERAANVAREGIRLGAFSGAGYSSSEIPNSDQYKISLTATLNSNISVSTATEVSKQRLGF
jgi:hypothetical protein